MKINNDGSIYLDKGETVPFICPKCKWPLAYDTNLLAVHCFQCGFVGISEDFSADLKL